MSQPHWQQCIKACNEKVGCQGSTANMRPELLGHKFSDWLMFGNAGNYGVTQANWLRVCGWTTLVHDNHDYGADSITFHLLVVEMKKDLQLELACDCWLQVLPKSNQPNFPFCVLMLMLCTPLVPDTKIIEVFRPLFTDNHVDEAWIIGQGEKTKAATVGLSE